MTQSNVLYESLTEPWIYSEVISAAEEMFVLKGKLLGKGSLQARKCLLTQKQRGLEGFAVVDWESS